MNVGGGYTGYEVARHHSPCVPLWLVAGFVQDARGQEWEAAGAGSRFTSSRSTELGVTCTRSNVLECTYLDSWVGPVPWADGCDLSDWDILWVFEQYRLFT
jgi:hypothetical protein